jgi:hypothetical protein
MKTIISRRYRPNETTGILIVFDQDIKMLELVSLELPDWNNQKNFSCIPEGIYKLKKIIRPNGDPAFLVENVPGRDSILIHIANFAAGEKIDLKGCIAPGMYLMDLNMDGNLDAAESTRAMKKLLNVLPDVSTLVII